MPRYDPVVCDLDGTLVDSREAIAASVRAACRALGAALPASLDLSFCVGPPLTETLPTLLGGTDRLDEAIRAYRVHYLESGISLTKAMPGAADALEAWAGARIAMAIATYRLTAIAEAVLDATGLRRHFGAVVGWRDEEPLPKSALVTQAMERLSPHAGRPLYIGDHPEDERAARELGIPFEQYGARSWPDLQTLVLAASAG